MGRALFYKLFLQFILAPYSCKRKNSFVFGLSAFCGFLVCAGVWAGIWAGLGACVVLFLVVGGVVTFGGFLGAVGAIGVEMIESAPLFRIGT